MIHAAPSRDPASHCGLMPPTSDAINATTALPTAKIESAASASTASAAALVAMPAYMGWRRCAGRAIRSSRRVADRRTPATTSSASPADCRVTARRSSGLEAMLWSTRCISSLARTRSVSSSVCRAPERLLDQALQLAGRRQLGDDALDHPVPDERARDLLGQRPGQRAVDDAGDLGRRDDVLGRGLDPTAPGARGDSGRVERGASRRVGDPWALAGRRHPGPEDQI